MPAEAIIILAVAAILYVYFSQPTESSERTESVEVVEEPTDHEAIEQENERIKQAAQAASVWWWEPTEPEEKPVGGYVEPVQEIPAYAIRHAQEVFEVTDSPEYKEAQRISDWYNANWRSLVRTGPLTAPEEGQGENR